MIKRVMEATVFCEGLESGRMRFFRVGIAPVSDGFALLLRKGATPAKNLPLISSV